MPEEYTTATGLKPTSAMRAALAYVDRCFPVFPCEPGGKRPLTQRGFLDATSDRSRAHAYWNAHPGANIGIPTGERSRLLVLDVDNFTSLEVLEAERGKLPETTTVKTGSGGIHVYFRYPAGETIRNSAGKLGPGLDVRGEGGYVIAPGSATTGPYEWLDRRPLADAPAWLLEAMREPSSDRSGAGERSATPIGTGIGGSPIPEGQRNAELTRIAGRLRARGLELEELERELQGTNIRLCSPPLEPGEVARIAASIASKPAGNSSGGPDAKALAAIGAVERELWRREWRGMGELSARDVLVALVKLAREHGRAIPAGVRVSVSVRALALTAAVSKPTAVKAIRRLRDAGMVRRDDGERASTEAGAFVLIASQYDRANLYHSTTGEPVEEKELGCGKGLRAPRLRWSAPEIRRLGKSCGAVLDALEDAGGSATVDELAAALHKGRPRDLRRRQIARLEAAGVVECSGETVSLAPDWLEELAREREAAGEISATRRDMARYSRESDAYRNRNRNRPHRSPNPLKAVEPPPEALPELPTGADGFISELEHLEPESEIIAAAMDLSPLAGALRDYLERNPGDAYRPASWLAVTLWAYDLISGKPTREEVAAALQELGGALFVNKMLKRLKGVA